VRAHPPLPAPKRRFTLVSLLAAVLVVGAAGAGQGAVQSVRVLQVSPSRFVPVTVRVGVAGDVGDRMHVALKVWDRNGVGLYSPTGFGPGQETYVQPYPTTALTLRVPSQPQARPMRRGHVYYLKAEAIDLTAGAPAVWSGAYRFVLR